MTGQGHKLSQERVDRILKLLAETDLTMAEIAIRMGCSRSVAVAINRKYQIRLYRDRMNWHLVPK